MLTRARGKPGSASASVVACLLAASSASAADYYVATSGSDAAAGTEAAPFATLHHGASVLSAGDTLFVRAGTYAEEFYNDLPAGDSWANPVTIAAYPNEQPVLQPPAGCDRVLTFASAEVHHIIVRGLVLDAVNCGIDTVKITWGSSTGPSHHIRLEECEVMNAPGQGILVTGVGTEVTGNEFIRLDVHHNGTTDFDHGLYISTADNRVEGCDVHHNAGWGVHVYNGSVADADANVIVGNRVHDNAAVGARGVGIGIYSGEGTLAFNNLVWANQVGISVNYEAGQAGVLHNTVFGNGGPGILVGDGSTDARIVNNIVFQNDSGIDDSGINTTVDANLADTDPLFVDETNFDFHLTASSPAVDAAVTTTEVTHDYDGVVRPQGSAPDQGAFEFCPPPGCEPATGGGGGGGADGGTGGTGAAGGTGGTGAAGGTGGTGASLPAGPGASGDDEGSCGCRVAGAAEGGSGLGWLALLLAGGWLRRRR